MPWTPQQFASRHNHGLTPEEAGHASRIANAILRGGSSERIAIATANKLAEHHAQKRANGGRAAGGNVPAPSYLAGTAGSPVNADALPRYVPQQAASTGILPSGLMSVPQTGSYTLDPNTGALTGSTQAALQALGMRGLSGAMPAGGGAAGAPQGQPTDISGQQPGGTEANGAGGGPQGGVGGAGGSSNPSNTIDIIGGQSPSIGFSGAGARAGAALGSFAGPVGTAIGAGIGGLAGGSSMGTSADPGAQPNVGDLMGGIEGPQADITGGGGIARGGAIRRAKRAAGGGAGISPSMQSPWWTRSEAHAADHPSGLINSPVGGRSDHLPINVPGGSYVIPADVVSGMGQGNTMAGAHAFDSMIHSGPFGTKLPMPKIGGTLPKPPAAPKMVAAQHFSRGGRTNKGHIPIIVAGGERIVSPEEVAQLSGGDVKKGHQMLDDFVVACRKHVLKHTAKLPGPVGA